MVYILSTLKMPTTQQDNEIQTLCANAKAIPEEYTRIPIEDSNWEQICKLLNSSDCLVLDSITSMSKEAQKSHNIYMDLFNKGVELIFLNERHLDTVFYRNKTEPLLHFTTPLVSKDEDALTLANEIIESLKVFLMKFISDKVDSDIRHIYAHKQSVE